MKDGEKRVLDLGAGKAWRRWKTEKGAASVVCVDRGYSDVPPVLARIRLVRQEIIDFLEGYDDEPFTHVHAHRILEHLTPNLVSFALWLIWGITRARCTLEIVVPNHQLIMERLSALKPADSQAQEFNRMFAFAHYEVFNEAHDPHRSIWMPNLVPHYIETEGLWSILDVEKGFEKEPGRDFFMKIIAKREGE